MCPFFRFTKLSAFRGSKTSRQSSRSLTCSKVSSASRCTTPGDRASRRSKSGSTRRKRCTSNVGGNRQRAVASSSGHSYGNNTSRGRNLYVRHITSSSKRWEVSIIASSCRCRITRRKHVDHIVLRSSRRNQTFSDACTNGVVLISRQSHSGQNTNDRHDDHQLDQGEALLDATADGTVHSKNSIGWEEG